MSDKYNLTEIANIFAQASGLDVKPTDIQPVEKAEYNGGSFVDCWDVYSFIVHNDEKLYTIYFYSPEMPWKGIKVVEVTENPSDLLIYQRGVTTHIGDQKFHW